MNKYVVRLWVDVEVEAESEKEAKEIGKKVKVGVVDFPVYEIQVANIFPRE